MPLRHENSVSVIGQNQACFSDIYFAVFSLSSLCFILGRGRHACTGRLPFSCLGSAPVLPASSAHGFLRWEKKIMLHLSCHYLYYQYFTDKCPYLNFSGLCCYSITSTFLISLIPVGTSTLCTWWLANISIFIFGKDKACKSFEFYSQYRFPQLQRLDIQAELRTLPPKPWQWAGTLSLCSAAISCF